MQDLDYRRESTTHSTNPLGWKSATAALVVVIVSLALAIAVMNIIEPFLT